MLPPTKRDSTELREARESADALERRFGPDMTLGQREMAAVKLRTLLKEIAEAGGAPDLLARQRDMTARLRAMDEAQFADLRAQLHAGTFTPQDFRARLDAMPHFDWDPWARRLFDLHEIPPTTVPLDADMVGYITTHVVQILEVASELTPDDVLYDLGSGLGFVPILASWLSGARAVGVEIEPAFVARARAQADFVGVGNRVTFVERDLREQDYPDATAVFMFYPVRDELLDQVIARVEPVGRARPLRLYSLGLSGPALTKLDWIRVRGQSPSGLLALESVVGPKAAPAPAKKKAPAPAKDKTAAPAKKAPASKTKTKAAPKTKTKPAPKKR